jgi:hypothetical protein
MPGRVEGLLAERTRRASSVDDGARPKGECTGVRRGDPDAQSVRAFLGVDGEFWHVLAFRSYGMGFDDDLPSSVIPPQGHGTNPEFLGERYVEWLVVEKRSRHGGRDPLRDISGCHNLIEKLIHAFGEN